LLRYLHERQVHVVIYRPGRRATGWHLFLGFDNVLAAHPQLFQPLHKGSGLEVVRVRLASPQHRP
jgi:hypothetical protein